MQSERTIFNVPTRGILTEVLISRIRHSNFLLRDVNTSLDELKESIAQHGLLHPIIVRIVELGGDSNYEVVAGNRRFAACKQLGWRRIMCHILELNQQEAFEVSLIENLQHKTLNPVEEARAYKKYVEGRGWGSLSELSHKIGKSHSYVCNRIRLLELPNEVLDRIVRRQTNPGVVQEVLAIKDRHQRQMVVQEIVDNDLTRRQVRSLIYGRTEEDGLFECISNSCKPSKKEILLHEKEKIIFRFITTLRIALMRLDDSLDVVAAHGLGGTVGALLTGVLAEKAWNGSANGLLFGNPRQLAVQAVTVLAVVVYSGGATFGLLKLVGAFARLRAGAREEGLGLDVTQHGEEAYARGEGAILVLPDAPAGGLVVPAPAAAEGGSG